MKISRLFIIGVIVATFSNAVAAGPRNMPYKIKSFADGYYTGKFGAKSHNYPEEIFIVSGRVYDEAFDLWLEPGFFASRPPGEIHGPFKADGDAIVLEVSFPSQAI